MLITRTESTNPKYHNYSIKNGDSSPVRINTPPLQVFSALKPTKTGMTLPVYAPINGPFQSELQRIERELLSALPSNLPAPTVLYNNAVLYANISLGKFPTPIRAPDGSTVPPTRLEQGNFEYMVVLSFDRISHNVETNKAYLNVSVRTMLVRDCKPKYEPLAFPDEVPKTEIEIEA